MTTKSKNEKAMFIRAVHKTIERYGMTAPGDRVGVALSGGADSVALLAVLQELAPEMGISLVVIHVNHSLRGDESDRDAVFVEEVARAFSLPLEMRTIPRGFFAGKGKGASLEDRARKERYRLFDEVRQSEGLSKIALGHTMDDQAETVLMKFLRGSGLAGLRGILPVRDGVYIRPLLETTRRNVLGFLESRRLSFVTDSSNADEGFLRNRVRRTILPELVRSCNSGLRDSLARMADIIREEEDWLEETTEAARIELGISSGPGPVEIDLTIFRTCHRALQRRLVRDCLVAVSPASKERGFEHVEAVLALITGNNPSGRLDLGGDLTVRREYNRLFIGGDVRVDRQPDATDYSCDVLLPGETDIPAIDRVLLLEMVEPSSVNLSAGGKTAFMDAAMLEKPLTIRNIRPGDRIQPLGMKGHKKVKDIFIDAKVSRHLRRDIPLLVDARSVIWIPGFCISDRVRVRQATEAVLKAEIV